MKVLNSKIGAWGEIKDELIYLHNIPPTKSLTQALFEYIYNMFPNAWIDNYYFIRFSCGNCKRETTYDDLRDIPFAAGDEGQLVCPYCQDAWLIYKYGE
jgi:hypothetical protein